MGGIESAIRWWRAKLKTLGYCAEARYAGKIGPEHNLWPHPCEHAGLVGARYRVRADGQTAYFATSGVNYLGEVVPFAETVMLKVLAAKPTPGESTPQAAQGRHHMDKEDLVWQKRAHRRPRGDDA